MKRTHRFACPAGSVTCVLEDGASVELPLFAGILRHPTLDELAKLLTQPAVARKYTRRALQIGAWQVLREFPRPWLVSCLAGLELPPGRRRALEFLLGEHVAPPRSGTEASPCSSPADGAGA